MTQAPPLWTAADAVRATGGTTTRDVQRCDTTSNQRTPDYWDVSYRFRGVDHRVQMSHSPGDTITVNRQGEPRE